MRVICAVILAFEAIVIGLFVPVAISVEGMAPAMAGGLWGGMAVAALVLAGLQKHRWAHYAHCRPCSCSPPSWYRERC